MILLITPLTYSQNKIAITFDDLPCTDCRKEELVAEVIYKTINILKKYNIDAIGFVNEAKLYDNEKLNENKIKLLQYWIQSGLDLGNHTYSHIFNDDVSSNEYEQDIINGEKITRPLLKQYQKELKFFRHPQLRTGPTKEYKAQLDLILKKLGYSIAPVTMDNDEYIYAFCYKYAKKNNDFIQMKKISDDYLDYMKKIFSYYENISIEFLGYNLNQILLLHISELNADYLESLINILIKKDYKFISLNEALTDKAYKLSEVISKKGISWIDRWKLAKGLEITNQPEISEYIKNLMIEINK